MSYYGSGGGGGDKGYGGGGGYRGGGGGRRGRGDDDGQFGSGGAAHLARIHGTEEDKVNCPFYYKIGACRHGDRCSRQHHKPAFSQTLLLQHMYQNPSSAILANGGDPSELNEEDLQDQFEDFFEEVYEELCKFGKIEEMNVCDNLGDHLVGNIYVKFAEEEDAAEALQGLYGRWYSERPIVAEYSNVTDFREARCRQYDEGTCNRGGHCNFMHVRRISRSVLEWLQRQAKKRARGDGDNADKERDSGRDKEKERRRRSSRSTSRGRDSRKSKDADRTDRRDRDRDRSDRHRDRDRDRGGEREKSERDRGSGGGRRDDKERERDGKRRERDGPEAREEPEPADGRAERDVKPEEVGDGLEVPAAEAEAAAANGGGEEEPAAPMEQ